MSLITPEQRAQLVKIYQSAFEQIGANVHPELIEILEDFSAEIEHEDVTQAFLGRLLDDEEVIILGYEPGYVRVTTTVVKDYYIAVYPAMRKRASDS